MSAPTIEIPPAATTALGMAERIVLVADELDTLGVRPSTMSVGHGYLWATPDHPGADDLVSAQVRPADVLTVQRELSLSLLHLDIRRNAYASGVVVLRGQHISVLFYCGAAELQQLLDSADETAAIHAEAQAEPGYDEVPF